MSYHSIQNQHLILDFYNGQTSLFDLYLQRKSQVESGCLTHINNVVIDLRHASMNNSLDDSFIIEHQLRSIHNGVNISKVALLISEPSQTLFAYIYQEILLSSGIEHEVFSTLQGAFNWLEIEDEEQRTIRDIFAKTEQVFN